MPTYEYVCKACEHEFEEFQSMSAPSLKKCPSCGKNMLERKIGVGAGIIFKGGGFYETDYRSESYKKSAAADGKTSSGASEKSSDQHASTPAQGQNGAHVHSGTCGCGKKPADQCASGSGAAGAGAAGKDAAKKVAPSVTSSVKKKPKS